MLGYFYLYELSASTRLRSSYFVYFQVKADCLCISLCSGVIRLGVSGYGSSPCVRGQRQGGHCHRVPPGGSFTARCCFRRSSLCPQGGASSCCGFTHCRRRLAKDSWIMPASLREDSVCHIQRWKNEAMQRRRRRRRAFICLET